MNYVDYLQFWFNVSIIIVIIIFADVKSDNVSANATDTKNKIKVECAPRVIPEDEVSFFFPPLR